MYVTLPMLLYHKKGLNFGFFLGGFTPPKKSNVKAVG